MWVEERGFGWGWIGSKVCSASALLLSSRYSW